jgi:hypothetical protein
MWHGSTQPQLFLLQGGCMSRPANSRGLRSHFALVSLWWLQVVNMARRLVLEWGAWVVRASALRKVFVSVKGIYFQASAAGACMLRRLCTSCDRCESVLS